MPSVISTIFSCVHPMINDTVITYFGPEPLMIRAPLLALSPFSLLWESKQLLLFPNFFARAQYAGEFCLFKKNVCDSNFF